VISGYNVYQSPQFHYVPLAGLLPGTRYFYQCGDFTLSTPDVSAVTSFITSPAVGSATDNYGNYQIFGVYMDSGVNAWASTALPNTVFSQTQLTANNNQYGKAADHGNVIQAILSNKVSPVTSILHAGDLSYADCNQPMWDAYDLILEPMASKIPFMASAGNHEQEQSFATGTKTIFTAFEKRYRMPGTPAIFTPNTVTPTGGTNFGSTGEALGNFLRVQYILKGSPLDITFLQLPAQLASRRSCRPRLQSRPSPTSTLTQQTWRKQTRGTVRPRRSLGQSQKTAFFAKILPVACLWLVLLHSEVSDAVRAKMGQTLAERKLTALRFR
jgi:hypothetical protein